MVGTTKWLVLPNISKREILITFAGLTDKLYVFRDGKMKNKCANSPFAISLAKLAITEIVLSLTFVHAN